MRENLNISRLEQRWLAAKPEVIRVATDFGDAVVVDFSTTGLCIDLPRYLSKGVQLTLRAFELTLLRELGVLPELNLVTLTVTPVQPLARYTLHPESGVTAAPAADVGVPGQALVALEAALAAGHGAALRAATQPVMAALRGPLREVLHYHLGSPQLRTRQVMADVRKLIDRENIRP